MTILRTIIIGAASAAAMTALASSAFAAPSATATIDAKIIAPASIQNNTTGLNFGTIVSNTTGGTVAIAPDGSGTRTPTGITVVTASTHTAADFTITAEQNTAFTVNTSFTGIDSSYGLVLNPAGCGYTGNATTGTANAGSSTTCNLKVGGTLTVPANAAAGAVSGTMTVAVVYP